MMDLWLESLVASGLAGSMFKWPGVQGGIDRWLAMTYRVADAIASTSRKQIEILTDRGVPPEKLSYVPIWVDDTIVRPTGRDDLLADQLGHTGNMILMHTDTIAEP